MSGNGEWLEWRKLVGKLLDDVSDLMHQFQEFQQKTAVELALLKRHVQSVEEDLDKHILAGTRKEEKKEERWSNRTWALLVIGLGIALKAIEWGVGQLLTP